MSKNLDSVEKIFIPVGKEKSTAKQIRSQHLNETPVFKPPKGHDEKSPFRPKGDRKAHFLKLCKTLGSESDDFHHLMTAMLYSLAPSAQEVFPNAGLAVIRSLEPKDALEAMLISQMFALNYMAMDFSCRVLKEKSPIALDQYMNQINKLTKRFAEHMDTLDRHRGKGQQKVTVEHVNVHSGGQAVVGSIRGRGEG